MSAKPSRCAAGSTPTAITRAVLFVDLRDRYGKTQVVVSPESGAENLELAKTIRCEWVLQVTGRVAKRPEGAANPKLATGEIELRVEKLDDSEPEPPRRRFCRPRRICRAKICG